MILFQQIKKLVLLGLCVLMGNIISGQNAEIVGIELAKAPASFADAPAYNFGTKLNLFVRDTAVVTGLVASYEIEQWHTNTLKDLKAAHRNLAAHEVRQNYRIARDTALLNQNDFRTERGKGFTFKLHSWALPDSAATSISIKVGLGYTVLEPGKVLTEDITHLAGNFGFETASFDFKGNTIDLKKAVYGRDKNTYTTVKGNIINKAYGFAVQKIEFLDVNGKAMDELYFSFNNQYVDAGTRNRVDLTSTAIIRIYYQKVKLKKVVLAETFGLGF